MTRSGADRTPVDTEVVSPRPPPPAPDGGHHGDLVWRALQATQEGVMVHRAVRDPDGAIVDLQWVLVNEAAARMAGRPAHELVGRRLCEVLPGHRPSGLLERYARVVETGVPDSFVQRYEHDGLASSFDIDVAPLDDGVVITFTDRTARQDAQRALAESEARYRRLVEHQAEFVCRMLPDSTFTFANEAYARYRGHTPESIVGLRMLDLIPPERREAAATVMASLGPERRSLTDEGYFVDVHGRTLWQQWTTTAVIEHDEVVEIQAVGIDITERKEAELALEAERARFAALVEHASDVVLLVGPDGGVRYASPSVERVLGWDPGRVANALDVIHPDDRHLVLDGARRAALRGTVFRGQVRAATTAGTYRWLELIGIDRTGDPVIEGFVLNARDVTDEVEALDALAGRAELLALLSRLSTRFIDVPVDDVDAAIHDALADLGAAVGVDRAYVFGFGPDRTVADNTHEWCAEGITPEIEHLQGLPVASIPRFARTIFDLEVVHLPSITELGAEWGAERELLEAQGIRSLVAVPMVDAGRAVGFVGFDAVRHQRRWADAEITVLRSASSAIAQLLARTRAESEVRAAAARFRALVNGVPDLLVRVDRHGVVLDWKQGVGVALDADGAVGRPLGDLAPELLAAVAAAPADPGDPPGVVSVDVARDGESRAYEARASSAGDETILVVRDVTEQRRLEAVLVHEANHDSLTGLGNRRLFTERVEEALRAARWAAPGAAGPAVLFVDLDGFKVLNDSLGHEIGDQVLSVLARRLAGAVRPGDLVCRLGGDEFAVLAHRVPSAEVAVALAERVGEALGRPVQFGHDELVITASIGVVLAERASTPGSLLRDADAAMYRAKANGRRRAELFTPDIREAALVRHRIEHDLRRAIDADQLRLHLQPLWSLAEGRWTGAEALVRWQHPARGLVSPGEFLPIADEVGLLGAIGEWVVADAVRVASAWRAAGPPLDRLVVWVNLAAVQLTDPDLPRQVLGRLDRAGLPPSQLGVEVTETVVVADVARVRRNLQELRSAGVRVALDDFGTGLSSLTHLDRLPLDVVKLDGSFVRGVVDDARTTELVRGIVALVHALGLQVVAEGVELPDELAALVELGVDTAQGFHLARPVPELEVDPLVSHPPVGDGSV
jgi:diguanylate cyclase (GGDEF)-like protein/PAS domain S-box-containing protein